MSVSSYNEFRKPKLVDLFVEDENTIVRTTSQGSTTFLNNSTIPTYEEFTKKTSKPVSKTPTVKTPLVETTNLVTDDESDEETILRKPTHIENNKKLAYTKFQPSTPSLPKTPIPKHIASVRTTPKLSPLVAQPSEYIVCNNKTAQTSFNDNEADEIVDESIIVVDEPTIESKFKSYRDEKSSTNKGFALKLSETSSDSASSSDDDDEQTKTNAKYKKVSPYINNRRGKSLKPSTKCNKRVSICGQAFSDDVLNIDDTIIDEYDNELDHKSGKLVSLAESQIELDLIGRKTSVFSSTQIQNDTKYSNTKKTDYVIVESSTDDDDKFEKFLTSLKPNEEPKTGNKPMNMKEFIVESDEEELEDVEIRQKDNVNERRKEKAKVDDKKSRPKNTLVFASSSSSSDHLTKSEDSEREKENDKNSSSDREDSDYDKDLQLFYIRTNNKLNDRKKKNEPASISNAKGSKGKLANVFDSSSETSSVAESSFSSSTSSLQILDSSDEDSFSATFRKQMNINSANTFDKNNFKTPLRTQSKKQDDYRLVKTAQCVEKKERLIKKLSFIESLSKVLPHEELRDTRANYFLEKFNQKKVKNELLRECFNEFNSKIFDNKLPADMNLLWNGRLSSTAGYCKNTIRLGVRSSEIHISNKVCTTPERMRDTLAHEICHAACFLLNEVNDGHGPIWKSWANLINMTYKHIPKITVSHSYFVEKKYIFKCINCHLQISRFSKSIDVEKEVCGLCHGRFEIIKNTENNRKLVEKTKAKQAEKNFDKVKNNEWNNIDENEPDIQVQDEALVTPRKPNKFAMFVKENYGSLKKEKNLTNHQDVMKELGKNFKLLSSK